jgi:hypothetical protein
MIGYENFGVNFDDPDLRLICEQMEMWLDRMNQDGFDPRDLIDVMNTYALFFGFTYAELEGFDDRVAKIRGQVIDAKAEVLEKQVH